MYTEYRLALLYNSHSQKSLVWKFLLSPTLIFWHPFFFLANFGQCSAAIFGFHSANWATFERQFWAVSFHKFEKPIAREFYCFFPKYFEELRRNFIKVFVPVILRNNHKWNFEKFLYNISEKTMFFQADYSNVNEGNRDHA